MATYLAEDWKFKFGIPADFFAVREEFIGKYIDINKLVALNEETLGRRNRPLAVAAEAADSKAIMNIDYLVDPRGGKRTPHLHYKGEIYLLNEKQWKDFSSKVLQDFSKKLAATNSISFEGFLELSETIGAIG